MQNILKSQIQDASETIDSNQRKIQAILKIDALLQGVDLSDAGYVWVNQYGDKVYLEITLAKDKQDSRLAHKIAQHLMIDLSKSKSWSGDSLVYRGETEEIHVTINGAVPDTCELVTKEVALTEKEYQDRLAQVKRTKVVSEVVCSSADKGVN